MRKVASNAVRAVLLLIGLLFALSAVGVDLTALSVLGGALGVGLGFGLQKLAANYVSGFVILLERSIRIGDNVKVDGFEGRITDIKTRYTLVRQGNGRESIVPNESLITSRVENLSRVRPQVQPHDQHRGRLRQRRRAGAVHPVRAAAAQPRVLSDPAPVAFLVNFAPDGLEFSLNFWIGRSGQGQGQRPLRHQHRDPRRAARRRHRHSVSPARAAHRVAARPGVFDAGAALAYNRKKARPFYFPGRLLRGASH